MNKVIKLAASAAFAGILFTAAALPEGYTQLAYIETTADGPYINTGYKPKSTTDIELKGYMPIEKTEANRNRVFYWSRVSGSAGAAAFALIINIPTNIRAYRQSAGVGAPSHPSTDLSEGLDDEIVYATTNGSFTINGQTKSFAAQVAGTVPELYVFSLNNGGSVLESQTCVSGARLEYFRILEGGVVQRDLVPCLRASDGAVGLYDISGKSGEGDAAFYGSAKTGVAFKAGFKESVFQIDAIPVQSFDGVTPCTPKPVVRDMRTQQVLVEGHDYEVAGYERNDWLGTAFVRIAGLGDYEGELARKAFTVSARLPKGYVPVEYLRSSGNSGKEYIDTGCAVGSGTKASIHFQIGVVGAEEFSPVFGARTGQGKGQFYLNGGMDDLAYWASAYGSQSIAVNFAVTGDHYFTLDGNVWQLDEHTNTFAEAEFSSCSAYVFTLNSAGAPSSNYARMDLFGLTIWDEGGKMVRRFVPCRRVEGDKPGLYDLCAKGEQKRFYENKGGGAFMAGPDVIFPSKGFILFIE